MGSPRILVIEDDKSIREAMHLAFEQKGFVSFTAATAEEANTLLANNNIEFIFVDCLLPGMSGDEFLIKVRKEQKHKKLKFILMSGIYTDKSSIQDMLKKTQAAAFLKKPFDLEQAIALVTKNHDVNETPRKLLYQILSKEMVSTREKRKLIESMDEISGYDLPFIYSLLSETKSTGYLNIYLNDGTVSGIAFSNGCLVGVDLEDKSTYIGELLIQSGFVSTIDIQKALQSKNNQRLGQRLISSNLMSPHALDLTMIEQMNVRLAKTISDKTVRLNFSVSEVELTHPNIDSELLLNCLHDWIASKISINWLKNLYTMWSGHLIIPTLFFKTEHVALKMNLVQSLDGLVDRLLKKTTLNELLNIQEYNKTALYKALHFLLTKGLIYFSKDIVFANDQEQLEFLTRIKDQIESKNSFELLQIVGLSHHNDKENAKMEIENLIGKPPISREGANFKVWEQVYLKINEAIDGLNPEDKQKMQKDADKNEAANKLKANQYIEEAKKNLMLNQFQQALTKLKEAGKLTTNIFQYNIYVAWARLGLAIPKRDKNLIKEIEFDLMQISPDERYDALYPYVMGLYYKSKNDLLNAKKSFDKSLAMDITFIAARRELSVVEQQINKIKKQENIFTMDLKDVVTVLFRKK